MQEQVDMMCDRLIDDGLLSITARRIAILEMCSDEWFNLLLDESVSPPKI